MIVPKYSRRTSTAVVALGAASLMFLSGCSAPQASSSAAGDTITIAERTPPSTLDPQGSSLFSDRFAWQLSYECLMKTDDQGEVLPALAEGYEKGEDGLSYTFTLRSGVTFSDGDTLDADDVVFTFERLQNGAGGIAEELFQTMTGVKKVDDMTVEFLLDSPDAGFVNNMANPLVWGCAVMSESTDANLATTMVGTGPWVQTKYEPETQLGFERNENYWGEKAKMGNLSVLYMPNMSTQTSNLQAGKIDIIFPDQGSAKSLAGTGFAVDSTPTDSTIFMQINDTVAPFSDLKVRKAMALAFDRQALAEQAYGGSARPSGYIPPGVAWAAPVEDLPNYTQNIEEAKQLLAEAGYPDGLDTEFMYITGYDFGTNDLMATLQAQLAEVGIRVELQPYEAATWIDKRAKMEWALSWNAQSSYSNPYQYIAPVAGRQGPVPESLQQLLTAALNAESQEAYQDALVAIEMHEAEIVYPTLTLLAVDSFVAYPEGFTGVKVPASQSRGFLTQVEKP